MSAGYVYLSTFIKEHSLALLNYAEPFLKEQFLYSALNQYKELMLFIKKKTEFTLGRRRMPSQVRSGKFVGHPLQILPHCRHNLLHILHPVWV